MNRFSPFPFLLSLFSLLLFGLPLTLCWMAFVGLLCLIGGRR